MRLLESIHNYDIITFSWCLKHKHRDQAVKISRIVSFSADGPLYVLAGVCFLIAQNWDVSILLALGFLIERTCYSRFKKLFKRNRPPEAIPGFKSVVEPSDQFSFPSGHTSAAFLIACSISFHFPFMAWILYPWACCVGMARVFLGVHFPSDVIAGATMGITIAATLINLLF